MGKRGTKIDIIVGEKIKVYRDFDLSWEEIGKLLGTNKSAAFERYARYVRQLSTSSKKARK